MTSCLPTWKRQLASKALPSWSPSLLGHNKEEVPRADPEETKALSQPSAHRLTSEFGSLTSCTLLLSCLLCGLSYVLLCVLCKKPSSTTWWNVTEFGILHLFHNYVNLALWLNKTDMVERQKSCVHLHIVPITHSFVSGFFTQHNVFRDTSRSVS